MSKLFSWQHIAYFIISGFLLIHTSCKDNAPGVMLPPASIKVVQVIQMDVPIIMEFVGQTYGEFDIPIRARVDGYLEGMHFQEGFAVEKGQLLYTIDAQPFEADVAAQLSNVAAAQTLLVNAKSYLNRIKPLAEKKAVSASDLDDAQAQYDAAQASLDAANANLELSRIQLGYTKITAPISGLIGKTQAKVGEYVGKDPNPVILNTVSDIKNIYVDFFLNESQYLSIAKAVIKRDSVMKIRRQRQDDILELILADGSTFNHKGKIDFIDRGVDANTGSILVQASFPNPQKVLRPGQYAKVKVTFDTIRNALLVPQRCISELQGQHSVYVVNSDSIVESRQVKTGQRIGDLWLITEGVKDDDKVILEGLQKVSEGVKINPVLTDFESKTTQQ